MLNVIADLRWSGDHGIGRFARQVLEQLPHSALKISGRPMDAVDPFRLSVALRGQLDGSVFFSPGYNAPIRSPIPYVFTVHDLNHIDRPENSSFPKRFYYAAILRPCCGRAARVLTVSEYARNRIVEWAGVSDEQVVNVGNGVSADFGTQGESRPEGRPYFLCVSNRRPHKNEPRVLKAFAAAGLPSDVELVLTGPQTRDLQNLIEANGLTGRVRVVGTITDVQLAALYRSAVALVFPSLYEGFGLPVVEAMACGTPVITSNTTALPEIAGGAAVLVDPESVDAIADSILRMFKDAELRRRLRDSGLIRAKNFQWSAVTERVANTVSQIR